MCFFQMCSADTNLSILHIRPFFLTSYRALDVFLCSWGVFFWSLEVLNPPNMARKDRNNFGLLKALFPHSVCVVANNNLPGGVFTLSSLWGVVLDVELLGDVDKERLFEWAALTMRSARLKLPGFPWAFEETSLKGSTECFLNIMLLQSSFEIKSKCQTPKSHTPWFVQRMCFG